MIGLAKIRTSTYAGSYSQDKELEAENPKCEFVGLAHLTEVLISNMSCRQFDNGSWQPMLESCPDADVFSSTEHGGRL